jgi:hypothetical protein
MHSTVCTTGFVIDEPKGGSTRLRLRSLGEVVLCASFGNDSSFSGLWLKNRDTRAGRGKACQSWEGFPLPSSERILKGLRFA